MGNRKNSDSRLIEMLGVAFVALKLCGEIDWNWLWVLSPFWIQAAFLVLIRTVDKLRELDSSVDGKG